jgi:hypothetical protein
MSASWALLSGRVVSTPAREHTGTPNVRATALLRVDKGEFWRMYAFARTESELMALDVGDPVSIIGEFEIRPIMREGEAALDRTITVRRILSLTPTPAFLTTAKPAKSKEEICS